MNTQLLNRIDSIIEKSKKYVPSEDKIPKGYTSQHGPKGGIYYDTSTKNTFKSLIEKILEIDYNALISGKRKTPENASKEIEKIRVESIGKENHYFNYQLFGEWIEGQVFNILGMRILAYRMLHQKVPLDKMKDFLEAVTHKEMSESEFKNVFDLARAVSGVDDDQAFLSLGITRPNKVELLEKEKAFTEKVTKQLFGDTIILYRGIYGEPAKEIRAGLEKNGQYEIEELSLSSYSQDPIAAYGQVFKRDPNFIVIQREVKAEDILSAWYANNVYLDIMPNQKEVLVLNRKDKFTVTKKDVLFQQ